MRLLIRVILLINILCAVGSGSSWKLLHFWDIPVENPKGYLIYGGGENGGYLIAGSPNPSAFRVSWPITGHTGVIISSFPVPVGSWGICVGPPPLNSYLISNNANSYIYNLTSAGSIIYSYLSPFTGPADIDEYYYVLNDILIAYPNQNLIAQVRASTGSLIASWPGPGTSPTATAGYQSNLVADWVTHTIYNNGLPIITGIESPVGMDESATMRWNYYVVIIDAATKRMYEYGLLDAVTPASFGRVKALFK
jgi:hypothetical protein